MRGVVGSLRLRPVWLAAAVAFSFAVGTPAFGSPVISDFLSGANGLPVSAGVSINFSFSVTDNIDPTGAAVHWDFGDSTTANTTVSGGAGSTSHTFTTKGIHTVVVKVTDDLGAFDTEQIDIDVRNSTIVLVRTSPATSSAIGGQPFTWTATVTSADGTPGTPTGNVTFTNIDGEFGGPAPPFVLGIVPLDGSGVATLQHSLHPRSGTQRIIAAYEGNGTFDAIAIPNGNANTVSVSPASKGNTTTTVVANSSPSGAGASASFTVTVVPVTPSTDTPTGSVSINFGDGSPASDVALTNGTASVNHTYAAVGTGTYDVNASYVASTDYQTSSAVAASQTVVKGNQTISFSSSAPGSAVVGGTHYTPTATASPSGLTVALTVDGTSSSVCSISGGEVSFLAAGNCTINANQAGDTNYNAAPQVQQSFSVGKGSQTVSFTFPPPAGVVVGGPHYTPTATATSGLAVALTVDAASSSICSISGGSISFIAPGTCTVDANQSGNANYDPAPQVQQPISVAKGATTVTASATPSLARPGQAVTLKATVAATAPATGTPTGMVVFREGTKKLGEGTLASGKASFSAAGLKIGSHSITANYAGSSKFEASSGGTTVAVRAGIGTETGANTFTDGAQQFPAIARLNGGYGGYLVVWASNGQDTSGYGIYGQRYNSNGTKNDAELHVSSAISGNQTMPKIAGLTGAKYIVVWQSDGQDGSGSGIYAQQLKGGGTPIGTEFRVNTTTKAAQTQPAIAALSGGGFVIAWTSNGQDKSALGVYAQLYDSKAKAVGGEFPVNKTTAGAQSAPTIAALDDGGFVIAWQSDGQDGDGLGIYGQRYDSTAKRVGPEFLINRTTVGDQSLPSVAGLADGGFVVTWQSSDGAGLGVYMQRFKATGARNGGEVRINTTTANDQWQPQVSGFGGGGFVVLWTSNLQDGGGKGVYAQAYDAAGVKADAEFLINTTTQNDQWQPAVAAASAGDFMAAWTSRDQDGSLEGVFTQRFMVPLGP